MIDTPTTIWDDMTVAAGSGGTFGTGITASGTYSNIEVNLDSNKEFQELRKKIMCIETQLMILTPDFNLHERYPALKEAYDAYQVILKLVKDNANNTKKHE